MTETILILAMVAIATIGIVGIFGDQLRALFAGASDALAGDDQVSNRHSGMRPASQRTLKTFGKNAAAGSPMHPD